MEKSPITLIGTQPTREQKIAATQSHPAKLDQFSTAIDTGGALRDPRLMAVIPSGWSSVIDPEMVQAVSRWLRAATPPDA